MLELLDVKLVLQWEFEDPLVGRFFCGRCSLLEDHGNNNPWLGDGWDLGHA